MAIARKYKAVIPRYSRPTLTSLILDKIAEAGEVPLDSFFPAKYPGARRWRKILGLDASYEFKRKTFSSILFQLQSQGLVERRKRKSRNYWYLTPVGREAAKISVASKSLLGDGKTRIVCFDIPERDRAKRRWLRGELIALGYQALQKSVWIGTKPLPKDFIESLDDLDLRGRVHIFMVASEGTLKTSDENV